MRDPLSLSLPFRHFNIFITLTLLIVVIHSYLASLSLMRLIVSPGFHQQVPTSAVDPGLRNFGNVSAALVAGGFLVPSKTTGEVALETFAQNGAVHTKLSTDKTGYFYHKVRCARAYAYVHLR